MGREIVGMKGGMESRGDGDAGWDERQKIEAGQGWR